MPQPACQPDIAEAATVAPTDRVQTNADDVGIGRQRNAVILGKESKLLGIALPIVKGDSSLPSTFLVMIQFTQMGNDILSRSEVCADTLDERVVDVLLAILCSAVATKEHRLLLVPDKMTRRRPANQEARSSLHAACVRSTTENGRNLSRRKSKIANFLQDVRKIG